VHGSGLNPRQCPAGLCRPSSCTNAHSGKSTLTRPGLVMIVTDALHTLTQHVVAARKRFLAESNGDRITSRSFGMTTGCRHAQPAWHMPSSDLGFWRLRPSKLKRFGDDCPTVRASALLCDLSARIGAALCPCAPIPAAIKTQISASAPPAIRGAILPPPFFLFGPPGEKPPPPPPNTPPPPRGTLPPASKPPVIFLAH